MENPSFNDMLSIAALGILIVLVTLAALAIFLMLLTKAIRNFESSRNKKSAAEAGTPAPAAASAAAPAPTPVAAPAPADKTVSYGGTVRLINVTDNEAAMIMAIVSDSSKIPLNKLCFSYIKKLG